MLSVENNPKGRKNSNFISVSNEYCLIYAKNKVKSSFIENIPKNIDDVVKYEKEEPEIVEEKQENNVLPVVGGTTGIILVIVFFLTRNVTVYNYKDGEYKKVGKVRATKAGKIKLDRFSLFETTNKYKLELSKNLTKKLKGKVITVSKNGTTIKMLIKENEKEKYIVEVRI